MEERRRMRRICGDQVAWGLDSPTSAISSHSFSQPHLEILPSFPFFPCRVHTPNSSFRSLKWLKEEEKEEVEPNSYQRYPIHPSHPIPSHPSILLPIFTQENAKGNKVEGDVDLDWILFYVVPTPAQY